MRMTARTTWTMATGTTTGTTGTMKGTMTATTEPDRPAPRGGFSVRTRIASSVALVSAFALGTAGFLVFALESRRNQQMITEHVDQEIAELAALQRDGIDPETGRGFSSAERLLDTFLVRNVPDDDEMLVGYWDGRPVERTPHRLGNDVLEDPEFAEQIARLLPDGGSAEMQTPGAGELWVTVQPVGSGARTDALVIVSFVDEEQDELARVMRTYALVSVVLLALIVVAAWLQSGRLLRPLRSLHDSARDITATDLSRRLPETGNDDITRLTHTFNTMLARLEDAFGSQREFLDDAGHELRTPLTVLRGQLEVLDPDDPEEVAATRELLLDEIDRMARLVNDLILLASSERPDFVTPAPVDLSTLVESVHRKARAMDDRDWALGPAPAPGVTAALDEQRVTQALLQLCDNAVKHTGPGDRIELSCVVRGELVELALEDEGPGVPEADREHIFARFGRADDAADDGFGLGLSIVAAIAEAHGGSVRVEDGRLSGARFVLSLPRRPAADRGVA